MLLHPMKDNAVSAQYPSRIAITISPHSLVASKSISIVMLEAVFLVHVLLAVSIRSGDGKTQFDRIPLVMLRRDSLCGTQGISLSASSISPSSSILDGEAPDVLAASFCATHSLFSMSSLHTLRRKFAFEVTLPLLPSCLQNTHMPYEH